MGIIVGISTSIFLKLLDEGIGFTSSFQYYYLFLPVALFLSILLVNYLAPEAGGHGTEKVIEAVHKRSGKINPLVVPVKLVATIITIAVGGSVGKEGPCAQIGAGICSAISDLFRFDEADRKKLVICGISAGFATVFGTPIAGAIFGVEVLFVGGLLYEVLLPSFVAGIVSYQVSSALGITYLHLPLRIVPQFSALFFIKICLSGLFFGLSSLMLIEILHFFEGAVNRVTIWKPLRGVIGGLILIFLSLIFSTRYLGLGLETIKGTLEGAIVPAGAFLLKIFFTSITLAFGGSGGIITPIFFIGATAGNLFGRLFGLDPAVFSAIGMVCLLAGATNTPISASIMAVELFGPALTPYAALACIISFLMTGHRSVYPSQVLAITKSSALMVEKGKEMRELKEIELDGKSKRIKESMTNGIKRIKKRKIRRTVK